MKLAEYLSNCSEDMEITVWDKNYDMETYFYSYNDDWDKAMLKIAEALEIIEFRNGGVIVNLSEVIEKNIDNGVFEELFIENDVDAIMDDIDNIFAGNVSDKWLMKFADSLEV